MYTQKYFSPDQIFASSNHQIVGKNLFDKLGDVQNTKNSLNQNSQGPHYFNSNFDSNSHGSDPSDSKLNSTKDSVQFPLTGSVAKVNNLPIFKLLQAFKLQQYAKTFVDLGYSFEVYKIALLLPRQRHELLTKLNLMPGHRARFLSLFEIIDQIYPKEQKFQMMQQFKKASKSRSNTAQNFNKKTEGGAHANGNIPRSGKKRRSLMKQYNALDKKAKKDINECFIRKLKESKPTAYQGVNLVNVIDQHSNKTKNRKAIKQIFPPSMYDKYTTDGSSGSRSRSKKSQRQSSASRKIHKGHHLNSIKNARQPGSLHKGNLPPLPEISNKGPKYVPKSSKADNFDIRRASAGANHQKTHSTGIRNMSKDKKRGEGLEIQAMTMTKHSQWGPRPASKYKGNARNSSEGARNRKAQQNNVAKEKAKRGSQYSNCKSKSRDRSAGRNKPNARRRTAKNYKRHPYNNKSKSNSGSKKRQGSSKDGILSSTTLSGNGRLISSASTSDKRSVKNQNTSNYLPKNNKLEKIQEKPSKGAMFAKKVQPKTKGAFKSEQNTAVKKPKGGKSERVVAAKPHDKSHCTSGKNISSEFEAGSDVKKFGSIFTESGDKKIQGSTKKSVVNCSSEVTQPLQNSDSKTKVSKECSHHAYFEEAKKMSESKTSKEGRKDPVMDPINLSNDPSALEFDSSRNCNSSSHHSKAVDDSIKRELSVEKMKEEIEQIKQEYLADTSSYIQKEEPVSEMPKPDQEPAKVDPEENGEATIPAEGQNDPAPEVTHPKIVSEPNENIPKSPAGEESEHSEKEEEDDYSEDPFETEEKFFEAKPHADSEPEQPSIPNEGEKEPEAEQEVQKEPSVHSEPKDEPVPDVEPVPQEEKENTSINEVKEEDNERNNSKKMLPPNKTPKRSPLLLKEEKDKIVNDYGFSLDSKTVDETIDSLETENMCKCLAQSLLKHIEFSKGEVLVDDLVSEEEDIPQFSYEFGQELRIDLEEIERRKEAEQWEAQVRNIENFNQMYYMDQDVQYYENGQVFDYPMPPEVQVQNKPSHLGDLPPLGGGAVNEEQNKFSSHANLQHNPDLQVEEGGPNAEGYNYSLVQMDDFLKDQGLFSKDSTNLVNTYYKNLSVMSGMKAHFMPPPDLGMIESMGSLENTSKCPDTHKTTKKSIKSHREATSTKSVPHNEDSNSMGESSLAQPLDEMKSLNSSIGESASAMNQAKSQKSQSQIQKEEGKSNNESVDTPQSSENSVKTHMSQPHARGSKNLGDEEGDKSVKSLKSYKSEKSQNGGSEAGSKDLTQESYYILEDISKEGLQKFLKEAMLTFNERFSIEKGEIEQDVEIVPPDFDLVFKYCKYVVVASKMEKEIPILALVYLERLITRTGVLMNQLNWRRLILTTLCVASKIWDDDSLENEHFPKVMKDVTIKEINTFERVFLDLIGYDLVIKGAEYAKYYFILRTIAKANNVKMPLKPLTVEKIQKLHDKTNKAELEFRNKAVKLSKSM